MSSAPPMPKRKRSALLIPNAQFQPGSGRGGKRARFGPHSGSPRESGASTLGLSHSYDGIQNSAYPHSPSPGGSSEQIVFESSSHHAQDNASTLPHVTSQSPLVLPIGSPSAENTNGESWAGLEQALGALHTTTKVCPPLHSAIEGLKSCLGVFEEAARPRKDYDELANGLTKTVQLLIKHLLMEAPRDITDTITRISGLLSRDIVKEVEAIQKRQSRSRPRRVLRVLGDEDDPIRRYRRIERLLRQIQAEASMSTWDDTKRHLVNTQLENLGSVKLAVFNSRISMDTGRRSCAEHTRTEILHDSFEWADNPDGAKIYWMNGMAGTGKTTIAYSLCERLEDTGQLAASFFCTRTSRECSEAKQIVPTIAYQLARHSASFRDALCGVLDQDPDVGNLSTSSQFRSLLVKPLLGAREDMSKSLVVVIDALDECNDPYALKAVLDTVFQFAVDLPIKFFITSRPEPAIRESMMTRIADCNSPRAILYLYDIEESFAQADIELYLKDELWYMLPTHHDDIEELAEQAGNLFIYAATAVRYIQAAGKAFNDKRLKTVLGVSNTSKKSLSAVDALYSTILSAALHDDVLGPDEQGYIRAVLWTVVCACEPMLINTLAGLAGFDGIRSTVSALQPLRSVLHVSEHNNLVTTLHASFSDFIFSGERSQEFFCDRLSHDQFLAKRGDGLHKSTYVVKGEQ
ncbi:hypothetical protein FRC11_007525, partial [Ceratobasidium sp. 423]